MPSSSSESCDNAAEPEAPLTRASPLVSSEWMRATLWLGGLLVAALSIASALVLVRSSGYHSRPNPLGRVLSIRIGDDLCSPITDRIHVSLVQRAPAIVQVLDRDRTSSPIGRHTPRLGDPAQWIEFPSGQRVRVDSRATSPPLLFDFDADGVEDRVTSEIIAGGRVNRSEVLSGSTGAVLYRYDDPQEYGQRSRAFPLGDLDGDGHAELALLHPRCDRSTYDTVPTDTLFGARSWLSVISGKVACAP